MNTTQSVYPLLLSALNATDPEVKCRLTDEIFSAYTKGILNNGPSEPPEDFRFAGRPEKPQLVPSTAVRARKMGTPEGYAAMLHAICHIEFNAVNLALDAAYRTASATFLPLLQPTGCALPMKKPPISA